MIQAQAKKIRRDIIREITPHKFTKKTIIDTKPQIFPAKKDKSERDPSSSMRSSRAPSIFSPVLLSAAKEKPHARKKVMANPD
jgi:hypothetical protein